MIPRWEDLTLGATFATSFALTLVLVVPGAIALSAAEHTLRGLQRLTRPRILP